MIGAPLSAQTTDLSYPGAFEQVRASNPDHYEKLRQIVAGFAEEPSRVESDWRAQTYGPIDEGPALTPVTAIAPLAQRLRDLVISDAAELTQVHIATPVESLEEQERAFAAEGVDARWATSREAEVLGSISQLANLQLITLQVDCKTSTCRLQLAERAGRGDLIARIGIEARWILSRVDQHGTRISVAYVARDEIAGAAPKN